MPLLTSIHSNKGYNDFLGFLNQEAVAPTNGLHSSVVNDIIATLPTNDVWMFMQEVYADIENYKGVFVVFADNRLLYIENGACKYANLNVYETDTLYKMQYNGLQLFYSAEIPLYYSQTGVQEAKNQIAGSFEYGTDVWYNYLREVPSYAITALGRMDVPLAAGTRAGCYNMKVDLTPFGIIQMTSARGYVTKFQVRVGDAFELNLAVVENFEYTQLGQVMSVQDTPNSREDIRVLIEKGVIFANL